MTSQPKSTFPSMSISSHPKYRPDIDGLRAIAVLSVVIFHAFPDLLPGGFTGVDIFFVISGYLISQIITTSITKGSFTFSDFYSRRIKRIFPALALVLATSLIAGWLIMTPLEFKSLGKHVFGGFSFSSNIFLWNESGYFDSSSEAKPLLHLWSLGIEEQFYLIWPIILLLAYRLGLNFLFVASFICAVSFGLNIYHIQSSPSASFYFPTHRIWELLIGAIAAISGSGFKASTKYRPSASSTALTSIGATLIAAGIIITNKNDSFPGYYALLPTIGTALVILSGGENPINKHLLGNRVFVFI